MDLDPQACYRAIATRDPRFDGRLFIGVTSTGIYCRPICPARTPKPENCRFFATAAAAQEAGFRPCLRCRPEISPELAAWHGSSNTVRRALALIAEGALDGEDDAVPVLAERLGVGERQLRRLFQRHLGASPIAVAQTRRVLFAKQLIHETPLPMTEVALASGFGSVRRFNHIFHALFGRPPRELRRTAQRAGRDHGITLALPYAPPYEWPAMLAFLGARAIPAVEHVAQGRYCRTIAIDGAYGWVEVAPDTARPALRATIRFPLLKALPSIVARLRRVLDLNADIRAITAHLAVDPHLAPLVAARPGLRVPGAWDGFELAVRAVLGQQITVSAATGLAGKLVRAHGTPLALADAPAGLTHAFPQPETVAKADLAALGMPGARAKALSGLAAMTAADPQLFAPGRELEETIARLRELPGIGEWTAQYIAMRGLREPDAFPAADIGLLRAMEDEAGRRPKPAELLARAEAWRPWRAYAALHLWAADTHRISTKKPARASAAGVKEEENARALA
jgi:AraC family transcriptional regulator, regulatory protein of adaptative response / DNA-3-methyladenine glycosylase II